MTIQQTTFAMFSECFRCHGFVNAFSRHAHIVGGKCLSCNGGLRSMAVKSIDRLATYRTPSSRATDIAVISRILEDVSSPSSDSPFHWPTRRADDNARMVAAILSQADADVRARAYAAITAKIRQTRETTAASREIQALDCAISDATGIEVAGVATWARGSAARRAA